MELEITANSKMCHHFHEHSILFEEDSLKGPHRIPSSNDPKEACIIHALEPFPLEQSINNLGKIYRLPNLFITQTKNQSPSTITLFVCKVLSLHTLESAILHTKS